MSSPRPHSHTWVYIDDTGEHWCQMGDTDPGCTSTEVHEHPCDLPEEHCPDA